MQDGCSGRKARMEKSKKKGITWSEAAKIVLEGASRPLTHKEILQIILERKLKEVNLNHPQALACINAMLHANSRSSTDLFRKVEGRSGCYTLNENRTELKGSSASESGTQGSCSTSTASESREHNQPVIDPSISSSSNPAIEAVPSTSFPQPNQPSISGSLPPISTIFGSYPIRVTATSSASSSVASALADSRLNSLIAPTPDNMPTSALSKKRSVKPRFQGEGPTTKKPRVTFKLDNEKKEKQDQPTRPPVKTKAELKYMGDDGASKNFIPPVLRPPMHPTHTVVKNSSTGYFGQKRHKKMSIAAQVKRSKEGEVDLVSPDSILAKINVRTVINHKTFNLLPSHYQYQLVKMLPIVDREVGSRAELRPSSNAFSNEFFTSAFCSWGERLSEGEFMPEMSQKIQLEQDKVFNRDPWKTKHFEAVWGEKLLGNDRYVSPVEKSHEIMERVHAEWLKEQEREKQREAEANALVASKKGNGKQSESGQKPAKNLSAKQRAALQRQQKLANAKSATNNKLVVEKKTSDGKASNRGYGGKTASKESKVKEEKTTKGTDKVTKGTDKAKSKSGSKGLKQDKVNHPSKTEAPKKSGESNGILLVDAVNKPVWEGNSPSLTVKAAEQETLSKPQENPAQQEVKSLSKTKPPTSQDLSSTDKSKAKTATKTSRKKVTKQNPKPTTSLTSPKLVTNLTTPKMTVNTPSPKVSANKPLNFQCFCTLKPMMMCRMCGAFCHSDCISPMSLCKACMA